MLPRHRSRSKFAGPRWVGYEAFAADCDAAQLTGVQATAALLGGLGCNYREIGTVLGLTYEDARHVTRKASFKLQRLHPEGRDGRRAHFRDLLECMRNKRIDEPAPGAAVQSVGAGFTALPRPRAFGMVADDHTVGGPLHFLRDLFRSLDQSAVPA